MNRAVKGRSFAPHPDDVGYVCPYCNLSYRDVKSISYAYHLRKCFAAALTRQEEKWLADKQAILFKDARLRLENRKSCG